MDFRLGLLFGFGLLDTGLDFVDLVDFMWMLVVDYLCLYGCCLHASLVTVIVILLRVCF